MSETIRLRSTKNEDLNGEQVFELTRALFRFRSRGSRIVVDVLRTDNLNELDVQLLEGVKRTVVTAMISEIGNLELVTTE